MTRRSHRFVGVLTVLALVLTGVPTVTALAAPDIEGHWAQDGIEQLVKMGAVSGLPDGTFRPDLTVTRSEFVTMVNKSLGITSVIGSSRFQDVKPGDWFAGQVEAAAVYGYVAGNPDGTFGPYRPITREQAAAMLVRAFGLSKLATEAQQNAVLASFIDDDKVSVWAKADVATAVSLGLMSGYTPTTLAPQPADLTTAGWQRWEGARTTEQREAVLKQLGSHGLITRGQIAAILVRVLALEPGIAVTVFDEAGTYGPKEGVETISGDVIIKAAGVTLQNLIITGNLIIDASVGDGTVVLENVTVKGDTEVKGGTNGVIFRDCTLHGTVIVEKVDGKIRIVAEGSTSVPKVVLQSGAILISQGDGLFKRVELPKDLAKGTEVVLTGNFAEVEIAAKKANVTVGEGSTIDELVLSKNATGTQVDLDKKAHVNTVTADAKVEITGQGSIVKAEINISGVVIEQKPDKVVLAEGVRANIAGKDVPEPKKSTGGGGPSKPTEILVSAINIATDIDVSGGVDNDTVVEVTLTTAIGGAEIYYTLDGSTPTASSTKYTAPFNLEANDTAGKTITVKAFGIKAGYTNSVVASKAITFKAAADTVIDIKAINGVIPPVSGETPVTSITETAQFTGNVSWAPAIVGDKFAADTVYTATITLTPKAGYTLSGVAENFFTVAGATTVTNAANSGIITAVFPATESLSEFAGGDGTSGNPYQVATAGQLDNVRNHLDAHFIQIANIDLGVAPWNQGEGWEPIGTNASPFTGIYDGNNKTISDLKIARPGLHYVGLFGKNTGSISNVSLLEIDVSGYWYVGGLIGDNSNGIVVGSNVSGSVTGSAYDIGGLIGYNEAGGQVTGCYSAGSVLASSAQRVGGLIGFNSYSALSESCSTSTVVGGNNYIAGLVGSNFNSTIARCFATGNVTGGTDVGGLVGQNLSAGKITDSYATGQVTMSATYGNIGGLVGYNAGTGTEITNSYAIGQVTGGEATLKGGLVGNRDFKDIVTNSYWDTITSGQVNSAAGSGKTTAEMKAQTTFIDWDSGTIWGINSVDNEGYPFLRWQGYEHIPDVATKPVTGVSLNKSSLELFVGESETLTATVAPADATDKDVVWSSNNSAVATVDSTGKVTAVAAGTASITVATVDGGKTATCVVYVKSTDATLSDLTVNGTTVEGFAAATLAYNVELAIGTTVVPTVVATVSDTDKANALVTAAKSLPGTTTVVVTAEDGTTTLTYTISFTIEKEPLSVTVTKADKAPTGLTAFPTEKFQANQNAVIVEQTGNTVTVSGPLAALQSYAQPGQGDSHKYVALFVDTGEENLEGILYDGAGFTYDPDMVYYSKFGVGAGTFVQWIKAEEVVNTPMSFTLSKEGKADTEITINFIDEGSSSD